MPTTLDVQLRPATEHDARSMAVIKLSTPSPFSRIIDNLPDTSDCIPETTIIKHEQDIRRRIAAPNGLLSVASVQLPDGKEDIAGWGMWRLFDTPQPIENEPVIDVTGDDPDRLAKRCLSDFKHALVRGRNTYTAGTRNIRMQ